MPHACRLEAQRLLPPCMSLHAHLARSWQVAHAAAPARPRQRLVGPAEAMAEGFRVGPARASKNERAHVLRPAQISGVELADGAYSMDLHARASGFQGLSAR